MVGRPRHPLNPAFEKAREWETEQARHLTEEQQRSYTELKEKQAQERKAQERLLESVRQQLEERAKKRKEKAELVYKPPVLVRDPYEGRHEAFLAKGNSRLAKLDTEHTEERVKVLKEFEQERRRAKVKEEKDITGSWATAVRRAAREQDNSAEKAHSHELDKSR
jgi:hypothetical protein